MKQKLILLAVLLTLTCNFAAAKSFTILKIEDEKVYLDITKQDTISSKVLNVFSKPEIVFHPVTKKEIKISKKIGTLVLTEVKEDYAIATASESVKNNLELGLRVEFLSNDPIDTSAIVFGEEVIQEMGKNRNIFSVGGFYNSFIDKDIKFMGFELAYKYNFLLTYLYSFQFSGGFAMGEEDTSSSKPKFVYARPVLEWRLSNFFSIITGGRIGVKKDGIGFGGEGGIRIGKPFSTNLQIGGSTIEDLGYAGYLTFNKKIDNAWVNISVQVDTFPTDREKTFRMRIGTILPLSASGNNIYGGFIFSGRNTDTVGIGGDFGIELRF